MLKHGEAETREWNGGRRPLPLEGWEHYGNCAEMLTVFGKQVAQRVS